MKIEKALALKYGNRVTCPPDRGEPSYVGTVRHVGVEQNVSIAGAAYVWVTVQRTHGASLHVWPSNRLK